MEEIRWINGKDKFEYTVYCDNKPIILFANKNAPWNIREAIILERNSFAFKLSYKTHERQEEWLTHEHYLFTNSIGRAKKNWRGKFKKTYY